MSIASQPIRNRKKKYRIFHIATEFRAMVRLTHKRNRQPTLHRIYITYSTPVLLSNFNNVQKVTFYVQIKVFVY